MVLGRSAPFPVLQMVAFARQEPVKVVLLQCWCSVGLVVESEAAALQ